MSKPEPSAHSSFSIDGRPVGAKCPVFVIAEAGVNHDGVVDKALRLVDAAVDAGADAVKFQAFRAEELASSTAATAAYQQHATGLRSQRSMLANLELTADSFGRIRRHCDERSIRMIATPFDQPSLQMLLSINVAAIKIASTDLTNTALLVAAADSRLPLIVSTGASTRDELNAYLGNLCHSQVADRLAILHCVSAYPTPLDHINLSAIAALREQFAVPSGLSDHTTSTETGGWAAAAGACIIEKHLTLDRSSHGPDHAMSLNPNEFQQYVERIRQVERAMGNGQLGMSDLEMEVRQSARRSLVCKVDVSAGTQLTEGLLSLKRPGTGIPEDEMATMVGRRTRMDIPRDTILAWNMVE